MQLHSLPAQIITSQLPNGTTKELDLSSPKVMGILNMTPDSFSDGGQFNQLDNARRHCEKMLQAGVHIIDIGGESTRPNATPVGTEEELARVVPIVEAIRNEFGQEVWLSIDTSTPKVIEAAVRAGADIWNDVRALKRPNALAMAAHLSIPIVLMHMRGEPDTMRAKALYDDVVHEVITELNDRVDAAIDAGVAPHHIIIDPGFGFAKTYQHHQQLLNNLYQLHQLGYPILFGVSRKRFLGEVLTSSGVPLFKEHSPQDRDGIGMAAALIAIQQGASVIRTHNVELTMQAVALWQQLSNR